MQDTQQAPGQAHYRKMIRIGSISIIFIGTIVSFTYLRLKGFMSFEHRPGIEPLEETLRLLTPLACGLAASGAWRFFNRKSYSESSALGAAMIGTLLGMAWNAFTLFFGNTFCGDCRTLEIILDPHRLARDMSEVFEYFLLELNFGMDAFFVAFYTATFFILIFNYYSKLNCPSSAPQ